MSLCPRVCNGVRLGFVAEERSNAHQIDPVTPNGRCDGPLTSDYTALYWRLTFQMERSLLKSFQRIDGWVP